jgi:beta-glucosidase
MKKNLFSRLLFCALCLSLVACEKTAYDYPFQNPDLPVEQRAADLVSRLTLDEKVAQMLNQAPAIERLDIPAYDWWNECLHGIGRTRYNVTVFPQAIGMAAGWDVDALRLMADYTAEEGRAVYNLSQAKQDYHRYTALTYWTPNINIFRDPRWGRGQETYGEDPFLTASLAENFVRGLQGNDPHYLKAAACAKHFAVHSGPEWNRHTFDVSVSNYDLWDTYLPAFKTLADAQVAGFMCAYQAFAGQPCCGSDKLMIDILRNDWGFTGYVTSDCGAIDDFHKNHKTHANAQSAAADAVYHGTDLDCGREAYLALTQAVGEGLITEDQIDVSLQRLFQIRLRLGLFDPKDRVPFSDIDSTALESPVHKTLSLKMAQQSMVLLKNDGVLPIDKAGLKKVAILGPNANNPQVQLGNYNGFPSRTITPLDGIREALSDNVEIYTDSVIGYYGSVPPHAFDATLRNVQEADLIVYVGGISPRIEGEEMRVEAPGFYRGDRTSILLPNIQTQLMKALKATGKPLVFVMMTGSAIATPWESQNVNAILNAWYGGEFAGRAAADILFGAYNPSGRLPVTFYASDRDLPDFENYDMNSRTYRYFAGKALYPFGYGLSYTNFEYEWTDAPKPSYTDRETIECTLRITNTGGRTGDEVAQIYLKYPQTGTRLPLKELRSFARKTILAGQSEPLAVSIPIASLAKWSVADNRFVVPKGSYTLYAGGHSEDETLAVTFDIE